MKKVWIFLLVLLIPITVSARDIDMGTIEITGTTQFGMSWSGDDSDVDRDRDAITLNADAQYYFMKNVAVGGFFTYEDVEVKGVGFDDTRWLLGPQVTYNISYDDKLNFFVNGGLAYADYEVAGLKGDGWGYRVGGGVKYFVTNALALVGQVRYTWLDLGGDLEFDEVDLSAGLSVFF